MDHVNWVWAAAILAVATFWLAVTGGVSLLGWRWLVRPYRQSAPFAGPRLRFRSGRVGICAYSQALRVGAHADGLHLSVLPFFRLGHPPLQVPWEDITAERRRFVFDSLVLRLRRSSVPVRLWGEDLEPFLVAASRGRLRLDPRQGAPAGAPLLSFRTAQRLALGIVLGAVVVLLGGTAVVAGGAWLLVSSIRGSDPYQDAVRTMRAHPAARATLGEPITEGWFTSGSIQTSNASGTASFAIPVRGPRDTGTLHAESVRRAGRWETTLLRLEPGHGAPVDLLLPASPPEPRPVSGRGGNE